MGKPFSLRDRAHSFKNAFNGIKYFFRTQHNGYIHTFFSVLIIVLGFFFHVSNSEWIWLVFAMGFVFSAEIMNTAIEKLADVVSPSFNEAVGIAKDLAAAAVLVCAFAAAIIGSIIFAPKLYLYIYFMIYNT